MDGWVKIHRKVMNHAVFTDPYIFRLWIICLMKATYTQRSVAVGSQKVELKPGQFITGRESLADEYNSGLKTKSQHVDARTIWRWIKRLETWGSLSINSSNKFSVITIVNWGEYQDFEFESVQQIDQVNVQHVSSTCPTGVQHVSTNKKEINKELKEGKKEPNISFAEYVAMTQTEHDRLVDKLGEERTQEYIERLDNYKGSTGRRYKSDYRTILTWVDKDQKEVASSKRGGSTNGPVRNSDQRVERTESSARRAKSEWDEVESKFFG